MYRMKPPEDPGPSFKERVSVHILDAKIATRKGFRNMWQFIKDNVLWILLIVVCVLFLGWCNSCLSAYDAAEKALKEKKAQQEQEHLEEMRKLCGKDHFVLEMKTADRLWQIECRSSITGQTRLVYQERSE